MALTLCMQSRKADLVQVGKTPGCSKRDADPGGPQQLCPGRLPGWHGGPMAIEVVPQRAARHEVKDGQAMLVLGACPSQGHQVWVPQPPERADLDIELLVALRSQEGYDCPRQSSCKLPAPKEQNCEAESCDRATSTP